MNIVPYGYYSLREIFNKVGFAVFGVNWDDSTSGFNEDLKPSRWNRFQFSNNESVIYPITEAFLISQAKSFISHRYTEEEIENKSNLLFNLYKAYKLEKREIADERLKKAKRSIVTSEHSTTTLLTNSDTKETSQNLTTRIGDYSTKTMPLVVPTDADNRELIKKGIKYAHIAKGLRQICNGGLLVGEIIDTKSGKQFNLPKEFWLASKSDFSFGTSIGSYANTYSYQYNGFIICKCETFDKFLEEQFKNDKAVQSKAGRKAKINWKEFNVESMRRLLPNNIDSLIKQDALAEEMKTWCKNTFDEDIGLSTIKGKLKPIYDLLKEEA